METLELLPQFMHMDITLKERYRQHWYEVAGVESLDPDTLLPSVTTMLRIIDKSGPLVGWARNQTRSAIEGAFLGRDPLELPDVLAGDEYGQWVQDTVAEGWSDIFAKDPAAEGTAAHEAIAKELREGTAIPLTVNESERMRREWGPTAPAVIAAFLCMEELQLSPVQVEYPIFHPGFQYAGTVDLVAYSNLKECIIVLDWKRAKGLYDENDYQVAAYSEGIRALTGEVLAPPSVTVRLPQGDDVTDWEPRWLTVEEHHAAIDVCRNSLANWWAVRNYKDLKKRLAKEGK